MKEMLKVDKLVKIYKQKNNPVIAVDTISFSINEGEILGILGPNGAGKTTTIKCICGLVTPTSGSIFIDNVNVLRDVKFCMSKVSAVLEGNRNIYFGG
ncbi:MAG: ATP-binding cassette domain-containing protein [bacterium]|nr:ATP-binding cassette domain-containing protein [bacterium]